MHLCSRQGGLTDTSQSDTQVSLPSAYSFLGRSVPPPYLLVFIHLPSQSQSCLLIITEIRLTVQTVARFLRL